MSAPDRDADRLTPADIDAMTNRVGETLEMWRVARCDRVLRRLHIGPDSLTALYRVAVRSIGCTDLDLRDAELERRDAIVHAAIAALPA